HPLLLRLRRHAEARQRARAAHHRDRAVAFPRDDRGGVSRARLHPPAPLRGLLQEPRSPASADRPHLEIRAGVSVQPPLPPASERSSRRGISERRPVVMTESTSPNRDAYDPAYYAQMYHRHWFTCPQRKWREREENLLALVEPRGTETLLDLGCA